MRRLSLTVTLILLTALLYCLVNIYSLEACNVPLLTNYMLEDVAYYGDRFSDEKGMRAFPWGFEIWQGDPLVYFGVSEDKHSGAYSAKIVGNSDDDVAVLAVPDSDNKPNACPYRTYRFEVWVKLDNVKGREVRLILQWFNSSEIYYPEHIKYGNFYKGNSTWIKLYLEDRVEDPDVVKIDPVIELWGSGTVYIDDIALYEVNGERREVMLVPVSSVSSKGDDYTFQIRRWDGNYVWMGPDTWINVTRWDVGITNTRHISVMSVKAYCGISTGHSGTLTFWTNYTGDIDFCKYNIKNIKNKNLTCDLYTLGIDTVNEVNNLQLACKLGSNSSALLELIYLVVEYLYIP